MEMKKGKTITLIILSVLLLSAIYSIVALAQMNPSFFYEYGLGRIIVQLLFFTAFVAYTIHWSKKSKLK